jgi:ribosome modulation factor
MVESDAYTMGAMAYYRGDQISMNPYAEDDAEHAEWLQGWMDARDDDHDDED